MAVNRPPRWNLRRVKQATLRGRLPDSPPVVVAIPDPLVPELSTRVPLGENHSGDSFDHSDWDALLKSSRTADGTFVWEDLARNKERLAGYLREVAQVDFPRLQRYEQVALLLNA